MTDHASKGFDVFISYSTKDAAVASLIKHQLEARGLRCWKAPDDILPGESWPAAIMRALGICRCMVLVWSRHSMTSNEVSKELTVAMKNGISVIPFRLEAVEPLGDWAYHLANTHWMDAFPGELDPYVSELAQRLLVLTGRDAAGPRIPVTPGQAGGRRSPARCLIPAAALFVVAASLAGVAIGWRLTRGAESSVGRVAPPQAEGSRAGADTKVVSGGSAGEQELSALRDQLQKAEQAAAESRRQAAEREAEWLRQRAEQAEKDKQAALDQARAAELAAATVQNRTVPTDMVPPPQNSGPWLFPDSSVRRLNMDELAGLDAEELWRARNEIFARRGYIFQSDKGKRFARQLGSNYRPVSANQDAIFESMNPVEQHNVEMIEAVEKSR